MAKVIHYAHTDRGTENCIEDEVHPTLCGIEYPSRNYVSNNWMYVDCKKCIKKHVSSLNNKSLAKLMIEPFALAKEAELLLPIMIEYGRLKWEEACIEQFKQCAVISFPPEIIAVMKKQPKPKFKP